MPKPKPDLTPGTLFSFPLSNGGFGLGLIARSTAWPQSRDRLIYAYGFDRVFAKQPTEIEARRVSADDTIAVGRGPDRALRQGTWRVVWHVDNFDPNEWPIAPEVRWVLQPAGKPQTYELLRPAKLVIFEDAYMNSATVDAKDVCTESDLTCLPLFRGMLINDAFAIEMNAAIYDRRFPNYRPAPTKVRATWRRINENARRLGLYPASTPRTRE